MIILFRGRLSTPRSPSRRCLGIILLYLIVAVRGHAASLLVNHDFSSGLNGWLMMGTVFDTGQAGVLSDQGGSRVVLFQSAAILPAGTPTLTLSFDFFNALSDVVPLGETPDSVFFSAFHGQTAFGSSFDQGVYDTALGLLDADYRGPNPDTLASGTIASPSPKAAGWTRFTLPLPPTAVVTIGFEFLEKNGIIGDSTAAVDNVLLEAAPIPEPAAAGGMLVALGAWLLRRRRASIFSASHP